MGDIVKGYKVFNPDWTCKPRKTPFQYEVGKTYTEDAKPEVCVRGFHFCKKAASCFQYYNFDPNNKVAEVEALGEIDTNGIKSCTNKIRIVREIPWAELLEIVNVGQNCTGFLNTGKRNSGGYNSGDRNSGDCNTGNHNTGNHNTGNFNTGNFNSGDYNSGNYNSGDCNSGDYNTGCFNTAEHKIFMFDKISDWTYRDWLRSRGCRVMQMLYRRQIQWVWSGYMSMKEKEAHPEAKTTGGFLRHEDESYLQAQWNALNVYDKQAVMDLPNFDPDIFKQITGIDVRSDI